MSETPDPMNDEPPAGNMPKLLTVSEACDVLRISRWSLYELIRKRRLPTVRIHSRRLIQAEALKTLVNELREEEEVNYG